VSALTDQEREQLNANLSLLEEIGDAVGGWEDGHVTARRKSFTMTVKFDNEGDVFLAERFARIMAQCPALFPPVIRRLLELDDELAGSQGLRP
jgi:hypothetical protein